VSYEFDSGRARDAERGLRKTTLHMQGTTARRPSMYGPFTAVAGAGALILGLAIVDERVRTQIGRVLSGRAPSSEIASIGTQLQELLGVAWQAIQDQSVENAPLVIFSIAALVLVAWMTRT
jgi:hypothetical protein